MKYPPIEIFEGSWIDEPVKRKSNDREKKLG